MIKDQQDIKMILKILLSCLFFLLYFILRLTFLPYGSSGSRRIRKSSKRIQCTASEGPW